MGRRRPGQDPTSLETLLSEHTGMILTVSVLCYSIGLFLEPNPATTPRYFKQCAQIVLQPPHIYSNGTLMCESISFNSFVLLSVYEHSYWFLLALCCLVKINECFVRFLQYRTN